ncbi:MAG: NmrA family protein, partial [Myxococcales bacterium]
LDQGQPVRVIVRDAAKGEPWRARGAEVAVASLTDTQALTRALTGASGAYLLVPPRLDSVDPMGDNLAVARSLARAAADARVEHVAMVSSQGAHQPDGTGIILSARAAERELAGAVPAVTFVRAPAFLENWGGVLAMVAGGVLPTFLPVDLSVPMVATADIGRTAAHALREGGQGRQVIELSGPRPYSADDIAAVLSELTGRPVRAQQAPLEAVVPTMTRMGMTATLAELFRQMYAGVIGGRVAPEAGARAVRGTVTAGEVLGPMLAR